MVLEKRDIAVNIILTIVTGGIYGWYWLYCILKDVYMINNMENKAGTDILLSIVTCGIYMVYVAYQVGKLMAATRQRLGIPYKDDSTLYLILALFGLIIFSALAQNELNDSIAPALYQQAMNQNGQQQANYQQPSYTQQPQQQPPQQPVYTEPVYQEPVSPVQSSTEDIPTYNDVANSEIKIEGNVMNDAEKLIQEVKEINDENNNEAPPTN